MVPALTTCCWPPPTVDSVSVTPGILRISEAMRSKSCDVAPMLDPSGARTEISNCDWSSTGRKFLPTNMNSGTMLINTSRQTSTITQRWAIENRSSVV